MYSITRRSFGLIQYGTNNVYKLLVCSQSRSLTNNNKSGHKRNNSGGKWYSMSRYVPITIGVGLLGILQWKYIKKKTNPPDGSLVKCASGWEVTVYTLLPLRIVSRIWGTLTNIDLPVFLRPKIYNLYARSFGVDLSECQIQDLRQYRSLSEFFIRPLKQECRPVDQDLQSLVSPADGRILSFGKVTSCEVDQVKGVTYSLQQFLGEQTWIDANNNKPERKYYVPEEIIVKTENKNRSVIAYNKSFETRKNIQKNPDIIAGSENEAFYIVNPSPLPAPDNIEAADGDEDITSRLSNGDYLTVLKQKKDTELYQFVVYLAPGDYHRFHSPTDWRVVFRRHFQGKLLSVNPAIASWIRDLFTLNERAVYIGSWEYGFFSMTAVGATNVGSIKVTFDESLHTNRWTTRPRHRDHYFRANNQADTDKTVKGVYVDKGDLFGEFRLGSTVVLIFEAPKNFEFDVQCGQKIRFGEKIGSVVE